MNVLNFVIIICRTYIFLLVLSSAGYSISADAADTHSSDIITDVPIISRVDNFRLEEITAPPLGAETYLAPSSAGAAAILPAAMETSQAGPQPVGIPSEIGAGTAAPALASLREDQRFRMPRDILATAIAFQVFNAIDAGLTIACIERPTCREVNPIYGRRPKAEMVIATKVAMGALHYFAIRQIARDDVKLARAASWVTLALMGGVVGFNLTQTF
jgi:hypothetical protein